MSPAPDFSAAHSITPQPALATTDHLLGSLYDAVLAPGGFQDFIEAFRSAFRLKAVTMIVRHVETQEIRGLWLCGVALEFIESYAREYAGEDLLAQHMMTAPVAHFYASNLDIPHPERFSQTRFYREWVEPQGVACAAGGIVLREGAWLTQLILQRAPQHPPFSRDELDQFNRLVPHLQRAMQMRQRFAELQLMQSFLSSGLDALPMPTLLFDEYGRVAHGNRGADALLSKRDSLWLEGGHLSARDTAVTRNLALELGHAIRASRGDSSEFTGVLLVPRPGRLPLMLLISPLRLTGSVAGQGAALLGSAARQGAALLFIFDAEATPAIAPDLIRRLFGLSEAEAELAVALCGGKTLDHAADERGTSIHTIRAQLKSIFNKTGTKRQADLIALVLSSPAYFVSRPGAD